MAQSIAIHLVHHSLGSYELLIIALDVTLVVEYQTLDERIMGTISLCIPKLP